ncbi:MAG: hypothetical protein WCM76_13335 [Bacteroidota bacterium]
MKRFVAYVFAILLVFHAAGVFAQGYSLKFNRVIDTVLTVNITTCVDLGGNGVSGGVITVPAGTIWKVEAVGPLMYQGDVTLYNNCSASNYANYVTTWAIIVDDGGPDRGFLKRRIYENGAYTLQTLDGTLWLRAGTSMAATVYSTSATYKFTPYATVSNSFSCKAQLSIIEFLLVP